MKKINLTNIRLPDKTSIFSRNKDYTVFLGNHATVSFRNEKKARKFLADTNRFLNIIIQELNKIYIETFAEYRRLWFVLDNTEKIDQCFQDVNRYFKRLFMNNHSPNGNYFVLLDFIKLTHELKNVIDICSTNLISQDNYAAANVLNTLNFRIDNIDKELSNYGKNNQCEE